MAVASKKSAKTKTKAKTTVKAKAKTKARVKTKVKTKAKMKTKTKTKTAPKPVKKTKAATKTVTRRVSKNYRPSEDEPFMGKKQKTYFRGRLTGWKEDIIRESKETILNLQEDTANHPDLADRATSESERSLELRTRDRHRKLIIKIDEAIRRIDEGTYGYCEETGEPINVRRLDARPIATLSIEAQERHERREKVYRDD